MNATLIHEMHNIVMSIKLGDPIFRLYINLYFLQNTTFTLCILVLSLQCTCDAQFCARLMLMKLVRYIKNESNLIKIRVENKCKKRDESTS